MASEYGWGKGEILEMVYPDELIIYTGQIKERKLSQYRMLLAIVQNPYSKNPSDLAKQLQSDEVIQRSETLDVTGLENLKKKLSNGSRIAVK